MQYGFTIGLKNKILNDNLYNNDNFESKPLYIGLFISEGQPSEVPVELNIDPTGTGYERAEVRFGPAHDGIIENIAEVSFPTAKADWTSSAEKIFAIGIFTSPEEDIADSCIVYLPLSESEEVLIGEKFVLNPNSIRLQLA